MTAYYNEIDPYAAQWLRNLIAAGHIAPGDVDERSIVDVRPDDLRGYTQCHFFAGIGVWSRALRSAGWQDDRPVWTGSCPCQPFSAAGKGDGFADERHLWPFWLHLISQCRPEVIFGEQVASKDALAWLDLVQPDMEGAGYAFWPVDLCAAGVGAPHIRQRLWFTGEELEYAASDRRKQWRPQPGGRSLASGRSADELADTASDRQRGCGATATIEAGRRARPAFSGQLSGGSEGRTVSNIFGAALRKDGELGDAERIGSQGCGLPGGSEGVGAARPQSAGDGAVFRVADADGERHDGWRPSQARRGQEQSERPRHVGELADDGDTGPQGRLFGRPDSGRAAEHGHAGCDSTALGVGNTIDESRKRNAGGFSGAEEAVDGAGVAINGCLPERPEHAGTSVGERAGPTNGLWADADWLLCRDGKWRPVEPGTFPLAHGATSRVGRLRAYGNAIVAQAAQTIVETYLEHDLTAGRGICLDAVYDLTTDNGVFA